MAGTKVRLHAPPDTGHPSVHQGWRKEGLQPCPRLLAFGFAGSVPKAPVRGAGLESFLLRLSGSALSAGLTAFECTVLYRLHKWLCNRGHIDLAGVCSEVAGIRSRRGSQRERCGSFTSFRMKRRRMPGRSFCFSRGNHSS